MNAVRTQGEVRVEDIADAHGISPMTVRRDLQYLESRQLLQRTHGGAVSLDQVHSKSQPSGVTLDCRNRISRFAATFVEDNDRIFINGSRTALNMLKYVQKTNVQVLTNNGWAIGDDFPKGITIHFTGGEMRGHLMVGNDVMRTLLEKHADKTFIGCAAVYDDGEFRYDIPTEIGINEAMVSRTKDSFFVLADHTKFRRSEDRENLYGSSIFERPCTLITDERTDRTILDRLRGFGMDVIVVPGA